MSGCSFSDEKVNYCLHALARERPKAPSDEGAVAVGD